MLCVTYGLPAAFAVALFALHRANKRREREGEGFRPEGKIRWSASEHE